MGFAIIAQGMDGVIWEEIGFIILSWVTSPLIAGTLAFVMFTSIRRFILRAENSFERGLYFLPLCYWFTLTINVFFVVYKGSGGGFIDLSVIPLWGVTLLSIGIGYLVGFTAFLVLPILKRKAIANTETKKLQMEEEEKKILTSSSSDDIDYYDGNNDKVVVLKDNVTDDDDNDDKTNIDLSKKPIIKKNNNNNNNNDKKSKKDKSSKEIAPKHHQASEVFDLQTEQLFSFLQVLTACFGSFAHGANDVANAIGPFAVVISVYITGSVDQDSPIQWWVLLGGGIGIVVGLSTWGYKVMATIGKKLCKVTPSRGFNIELASAITVLTGSKLGLPLSTTHCQVGGVVGVGLADGRNAVNWFLVLQVFGGWVFTLPIAAIVSGLFYVILWNLFIYYIPADPVPFLTD